VTLQYPVESVVDHAVT